MSHYQQPYRPQDMDRYPPSAGNLGQPPTQLPTQSDEYNQFLQWKASQGLEYEQFLQWKASQGLEYEQFLQWKASQEHSHAPGQQGPLVAPRPSEMAAPRENMMTSLPRGINPFEPLDLAHQPDLITMQTRARLFSVKKETNQMSGSKATILYRANGQEAGNIKNAWGSSQKELWLNLGGHTKIKSDYSGKGRFSFPPMSEGLRATGDTAWWTEDHGKWTLHGGGKEGPAIARIDSGGVLVWEKVGWDQAAIEEVVLTALSVYKSPEDKAQELKSAKNLGKIIHLVGALHGAG